jgi:hypothetical protein
MAEFPAGLLLRCSGPGHKLYFFDANNSFCPELGVTDVLLRLLQQLSRALLSLYVLLQMRGCDRPLKLTDFVAPSRFCGMLISTCNMETKTFSELLGVLRHVSEMARQPAVVCFLRKENECD